MLHPYKHTTEYKSKKACQQAQGKPLFVEAGWSVFGWPVRFDPMALFLHLRKACPTLSHICYTGFGFCSVKSLRWALNQEDQGIPLGLASTLRPLRHGWTLSGVGQNSPPAWDRTAVRGHRETLATPPQGGDPEGSGLSKTCKESFRR